MRAMISAAVLMTCVASGSALAQAPAMSTSWVNITTSQDDCVNRAERIMRQNGYQRIERVLQSMYADSADGRYTIAVRCVAEKQLAMIIVAGPEIDPANNLRTAVHNALNQGR